MVLGSTPGEGRKFFFSPRRPVWLWGSPGPLFSGYRGSFVGGERPGHVADHSPSSRVEVKNRWSYNSTPPYAFMLWTEKTLPSVYVTRHPPPPHHKLANDKLTNQHTCVVWFYERRPPAVMNLQQIIIFPSNTSKVLYSGMTTTCFGLKKTFIRATLQKL
jgi:hypothetical protein